MANYWDEIYNTSMKKAVQTRDIKRDVVGSGVLGRAPSGQAVNSYLQGLRKSTQAPTAPARPPVNRNLPKVNTGGGGSGRSGGGGGGGGGGGAALGGIDANRMAQLAALLRGNKPGTATASTIDLPDYQAPQRAAFNGQMYDTLGGQWNEAVTQDTGTATKAGNDLLAFLNANYTNAFTNGNNTYATAGQAPGQSLAQLQQLAQSQGVDPSILAAEAGQRAGADQAFGNMWRSNAAASDTQHQGNVARAQTDMQNWLQGINAQGRAGTAQIGLARGQAQNRYDEQSYQYQREDAQTQQQIAMQEAMANWERQNQVQDQNSTNQNSYRNSVLEALLGLMPNLPAGVALPDLASLGLA